MGTLHTIRNDRLTVTLDSCGALLHTLVRDGTEYLWQGDSRYWAERDVCLFPMLGRLHEGRYTYRAHSYAMPIHGFGSLGQEFSVVEQSESAITFCLRDNAETRVVYPFAFSLFIRYTLAGDTLTKSYRVENLTSNALIFALGAHPGFQVPLGGAGDFADWSLVFSEPCEPQRIGFDAVSILPNGDDTPFPLEGGTTLRLSHALFDDDAIFLSGMAKSVTLHSDKSRHSIRVDYPDMAYLGLWHMPRTDAPYLCIEPWTSLPGRHSIVEDLETQPGLIHLPQGAVYETFVRFTLQ